MASQSLLPAGMIKKTSMTQLMVEANSKSTDLEEPASAETFESAHYNLNPEINPHDHDQQLNDGALGQKPKHTALGVADAESCKIVILQLPDESAVVKELTLLGLYTTHKPCSSPGKLQGKKIVELPNISKILIPISFGAIGVQGLYKAEEHYYWIQVAAAIIQWVAALLMIFGMYQKAKRPVVSKWLQRCGNLLCLEGLLLIMLAPVLKLPAAWIPVPMLGLAAILLAAFGLS